MHMRTLIEAMTTHKFPISLKDPTTCSMTQNATKETA